MIIQLPRSVRYPIIITALLKKRSDDIPRLSPLLLYKYKTTVTEYPEFGEEVQVDKEFSAQFDAPIEGKLERWFVKVGSEIHSEDVDILEIEEPCTHAVQFAGLCSMCGKDMTEQDYTYFSNKDRATIQLAHDSTGLTVSQDEASRLEDDAKKRLLKSKKLSLVVDLDQTIIHATVDTTVAEWQDDPNCVNHQAVKDVKGFKLDEDIVGGRGTWYYVKMRPGLKQFLEVISKLYELHIYTMGTRAYALMVKDIVDPDGTIFGERVLSRDESGSMTQKSLQRLFPVDTKMVVIIDDRGDVWKWSDNLVKVRPYDFFPRIGDINSSFLPKRQEFPAGPPTRSLASTDLKMPTEQEEEFEDSGNDANTVKPSTVEQLVTMGAGDDQNLLSAQTDDLDKAINAQKHDRPLARMQEEQDREDEKMAESIVVESVHTENGEETPSEVGRQKHGVLHDHDTELYALEKHLTKIHKRFYEEFQKQRKSLTDASGGRRRPGSSESKLDLEAVPDIKGIMPTMKHAALGDVVLVFSGVIPLGANIQSSDIATWAKSFGATVLDGLNSRVTHLVAARSRTAKVRQAAARYQKIKIVSPNWLYDSFSSWRKEPEENYLIEIHPEDRHESSLNGFQDIGDAQMLSEEDEESDEMDEDTPSSPADELDAPDMANVDWMNVDAEFKSWIGSEEDEDEDADADADADAGEDENEDENESENESMLSVSTVKSTPSQKRAEKRSRSSTPGVSQETNGDSVVDESTDNSRSNKRQRTLIDSSLKNEEAGEAVDTGDVLEAPSDTQDADIEAHEDIGDGDDFDDDDSFAAEFEREFLAQDEDEGDEAEEDAVTEESNSTKETEGIIGVGDDDGGGGNEEADKKVNP